jgi:hypothetical protein
MANIKLLTVVSSSSFPYPLSLLGSIFSFLKGAFIWVGWQARSVPYYTISRYFKLGNLFVI